MNKELKSQILTTAIDAFMSESKITYFEVELTNGLCEIMNPEDVNKYITPICKLFSKHKTPEIFAEDISKILDLL